MGRFSAAAVLHLAQPSLSEQIRQLEEELGVELFARTTRGLTLTEAGHMLRPEAEAALATRRINAPQCATGRDRAETRRRSPGRGLTDAAARPRRLERQGQSRSRW